jgi:hypothetical protein
MERSHQVNNMQKIYANGTRTLIWLGPDTKGVAFATFEFIDKIVLQILEASGISLSNIYYRWKLDPIIAAEHSVKICPALTAKQYRAISELYSRPWFSRLWVVQEFVANNRTETYWGSAYGNSRFIACFAISFVKYSFINQYKQLPSIIDPAIRAYCMVDEPFYNAEEAVHTVMCAGIRFAASDPRDRVYALLGMPCWKTQLPNFRADYSLSVKQVYQKVTEASIEAEKTLDILWYVQHPQGKLSRPSWVPRWDLEVETIGSPDFLKFRVCGKEGPKSLQESVGIVRDNRLMVQGIILDTISSSFKLPFKALGITGKRPKSYQHASIASAWRNLVQKTAQLTSDRDIQAAIDMTMWCRLGPPKPHYRTHLHVLSDLLGPSFPFAEELRPEKLEKRFFPEEFKFSVTTWHFQRHFVMTEKGFIGQAREATRVGDVVAILYGAKVPFILRPDGRGNYLLVGEAYLHGFMLGEAYGRWKAGEWPDVREQTIVLV